MEDSREDLEDSGEEVEDRGEEVFHGFTYLVDLAVLWIWQSSAKEVDTTKL